MLIYSLLLTLASSRIFVDYGLNQQGITLQAYFYGVQNKTFLDVGGYDPIVKSNTMNLYVKGWTGINVQASPKRYFTFPPYRPKDINLNIAIGDKNQFVTLYQMSWTGSSTTSQLSVKQLIKKNKHEVKDSYSVPTFLTSEVCKMYVGSRGINMMTVDVEGLGALVMKMNDWEDETCRPDLIITEQNFLNKVASNISQNQILTKAGYTKLQKVAINQYYVKNQLVDQFRLRKSQSQSAVSKHKLIIFKDMYNQLRDYFKLSRYSGRYMAQYQRETDQLFIVFGRKYQPLDLDNIAKDEVQSYKQNKQRHIIILEHEPNFSEIYIESSQYEINTIQLQSKKQLFHIKYKSRNQQKSAYILNQYEVDKSQLKIISVNSYVPYNQVQQLSSILSKAYLILVTIIALIVGIISYRIYFKQQNRRSSYTNIMNNTINDTYVQ